MQSFYFKHMKIYVTADWHVGNQSNSKMDKGINSRILDITNVLDEFISHVAEDKPDIVIVAGDLFHTNTPSPNLINIVTNAIVKISEYSKVIIIPGNHDQSNKTSAVNYLGIANLNNVYFDEYPIVWELDNCAIACFPYPRKSMYSDMDSILEAIYELEQTVDPLQASYKFLITHLTCSGFLFGSERGMALLTESNIDIDVLTSYEWDAVFMGHIHKQQYKEVNNVPIMYVGSPMIMDFGEEGQEKGYYIWEDGQISFQELNCRPYQTIQINVSDDMDAQQQVEDAIRNTVIDYNAIIRIVITSNTTISHEPIFKLLKKSYHVPSIQYKRITTSQETDSDDYIDVTAMTSTEQMELWLYNNGVEDDDELDTLLQMFEDEILTNE